MSYAQILRFYGFYGGLVDEMPRPPLIPSGTLDQSCWSQIREPGMTQRSREAGGGGMGWTVFPWGERNPRSTWENDFLVPSCKDSHEQDIYRSPLPPGSHLNLP